jgi:hypothetical protein
MIQLTVDTYGRWLPMGNKAAVDRLDTSVPKPSGRKVVANGGSKSVMSSETVDNAGAGARGRTADLLITNQLLYH